MVAPACILLIELYSHNTSYALRLHVGNKKPFAFKITLELPRSDLTYTENDANNT